MIHLKGPLGGSLLNFFTMKTKNVIRSIVVFVLLVVFLENWDSFKAFLAGLFR
jgi:hypothetical protein